MFIYLVRYGREAPPAIDHLWHTLALSLYLSHFSLRSIQKLHLCHSILPIHPKYNETIFFCLWEIFYRVRKRTRNRKTERETGTTQLLCYVMASAVHLPVFGTLHWILVCILGVMFRCLKSRMHSNNKPNRSIWVDWRHTYRTNL